MKIWDWQTLDCVGSLQGHKLMVRAVKFDQRYPHLSEKPTVCFVRDALCVLDRPCEQESLWMYLCVCRYCIHVHSHVGRWLCDGCRSAVTGAGDGDIRIWDLRTRNCEQVLKGHDCHVKVLQFDNTKIVSGAKVRSDGWMAPLIVEASLVGLAADG